MEYLQLLINSKTNNQFELNELNHITAVFDDHLNSIIPQLKVSEKEVNPVSSGRDHKITSWDDGSFNYYNKYHEILDVVVYVNKGTREVIFWEPIVEKRLRELYIHDMLSKYPNKEMIEYQQGYIDGKLNHTVLGVPPRDEDIYYHFWMDIKMSDRGKVYTLHGEYEEIK